MINNTVTSPLIANGNVKLIDRIPVFTIIKKYKEELNIDISSLFSEDYISIYECLSTSYRFYYPESIEGNDRLYEQLQKNIWYYSKWNWEHEIAYKYIRKNYNVLEVGCGTGGFIEKLNNDKINSVGIELNKEAIKTCNQKGLTVYNEILCKHSLNNPKKYDVVCSFQVLEHVSRCGSFIEDCIALVKPGGLIIFGVPNNNPFVYKRDKYHTLNMPPHHMGLWSSKAFSELPKFFPLKLIKIDIEPLSDSDKRYYFECFFRYNNLSFFNFLLKRISNKNLHRLAQTMNWQGRNLIAIFEKL